MLNKSVPVISIIPHYSLDDGQDACPTGIREYLLCSECEKYLNANYEKPFLKQWTVDSPLPDSMAQDAVHSVAYDYPMFKLFHLSILFRSSVSALPIFRKVNLRAHEERIRLMLISKDPGKDWEYPIFGRVVLHGGKVERRLITAPIAGRYEGHVVYEQMYGGVVWHILVSSHRNDSFCQAGLQPTGHITLFAVPWNEVWGVQDASIALKRADLKK
ncbi:MAG: hypothetical protein HY265_06605 [Deltaproteobacteria bacterium]|nr:hypothetical protein [Deltaproteobacteria bacterium]